MAIDIGRRRCGIAVTDALRIVATGLPTVATSSLIPFVKAYTGREEVGAVIVGYPRDLRGNESESMAVIRPLVGRLRKEIPGIPLVMWDERFTSTMAHRAMIDSGMRKSRRQVKANADEMAAVIILNSFLESRQYNENPI